MEPMGIQYQYRDFTGTVSLIIQNAKNTLLVQLQCRPHR